MSVLLGSYNRGLNAAMPIAAMPIAAMPIAAMPIAATKRYFYSRDLKQPRSKRN